MSSLAVAASSFYPIACTLPDHCIVVVHSGTDVCATLSGAAADLDEDGIFEEEERIHNGIDPPEGCQCLNDEEREVLLVCLEGDLEYDQLRAQLEFEARLNCHELAPEGVPNNCNTVAVDPTLTEETVHGGACEGGCTFADRHPGECDDECDLHPEVPPPVCTGGDGDGDTGGDTGGGENDGMEAANSPFDHLDAHVVCDVAGCTVSAELFSYVAANPVVLVDEDHARLRPASSDGQQVGWRLAGAEGSSLARALGFRNGDVFVAIDGLPTRTFEETIDAVIVTAFADDDEAELTFIRGGQSRVRSIRVDGRSASP